MYPDWQHIKHLLLVSLLEPDSQITLLCRVLPLLERELPQINLTVLTESADAFQNSFPNEYHSILGWLSLPFPFSDLTNQSESLIQILQKRSFEAVILFTQPQQSPYLMAYCCYLAGIPIRVGQSCEFGGGILSHWIQPPLDSVDSLDYQLHLLRSIGLAIDKPVQTVVSNLISASPATRMFEKCCAFENLLIPPSPP